MMMTVSECAICLATACDNTTGLNSCAHVFCRDCIVSWTNSQAEMGLITPCCPLCKRPYHLYSSEESKAESIAFDSKYDKSDNFGTIQEKFFQVVCAVVFPDNPFILAHIHGEFQQKLLQRAKTQPMILKLRQDQNVSLDTIRNVASSLVQMANPVLGKIQSEITALQQVYQNALASNQPIHSSQVQAIIKAKDSFPTIKGDGQKNCLYTFDSELAQFLSFELRAALLQYNANYAQGIKQCFIDTVPKLMPNLQELLNLSANLSSRDADQTAVAIQQQGNKLLSVGVKSLLSSIQQQWTPADQTDSKRCQIFAFRSFNFLAQLVHHYSALESSSSSV